MTLPPMHRNTMAGLLQPPRSRFMINDILAGNAAAAAAASMSMLASHTSGGGKQSSTMSDDGRHSSSPPQPRDLSLTLGGNVSQGLHPMHGLSSHHHHHSSHSHNQHHMIDDSDTDSSTGMDNHSISSSGK